MTTERSELDVMNPTTTGGQYDEFGPRRIPE